MVGIFVLFGLVALLIVGIPYVHRHLDYKAAKTMLPILVEKMCNSPYPICQAKSALRAYKIAILLGKEAEEAKKQAQEIICCSCSKQYCVVHIIRDGLVIDSFMNPNRETGAKNVRKLRI